MQYERFVTYPVCSSVVYLIRLFILCLFVLYSICIVLCFSLCVNVCIISDVTESLRFDYGEKDYGRLYPKLQRAHASGVSSEAIPPWSSSSLRDFMVLSVVISTKVNSLFHMLHLLPSIILHRFCVCSCNRMLCL